MIRLSISLSLVAMVWLSAGPAMAQPARFDFDKIDRMQAEQGQRITINLNSGKITQTEANRFRERMQEVTNLEAQLRQSGSGLSWTERRELIDKLERINNQLDREITNGRPDTSPQAGGGINTKQAELELRIDKGIQNGSLTHQEADQLKRKSARIGLLEQQMRAGGLSDSERDSLHSELDSLSRDISHQIHDSDTAGNTASTTITRPSRWTPPSFSYDFGRIDRMQAEQRQRIADAVRNGKITQREADRLAARVREVAVLEAQLRESGNRLSWSESRDLSDKLEQISDQIERDIHDGRFNGFFQVSADTNIDSKQAYINQRIDAGVRNGSLSAAEAAQLHRKYDRIADLEQQMRGGGLNNSEREKLSDELNRLSSEVFRQMHDFETASRPTNTSTPQSTSTRPWNSSSYDFDRTTRILQEQKQKMKQALRTGKITRRQFDRLLSKTQEITNLEAQLRSAGGRLSWRERLRITDELDALTVEIDRTISNQRIGSDYRRDQRLQTRYSRITEIEARLSMSGGSIPQSERRSLSDELNQLSQEVFEQRNNRNRSF